MARIISSLAIHGVDEGDIQRGEQVLLARAADKRGAGEQAAMRVPVQVPHLRLPREPDVEMLAAGAAQPKRAEVGVLGAEQIPFFAMREPEIELKRRRAGKCRQIGDDGLVAVRTDAAFAGDALAQFGAVLRDAHEINVVHVRTLAADAAGDLQAVAERQQFVGDLFGELEGGGELHDQ